MIRIHTADGRTVAMSLRDETQARELLRMLSSDNFQRCITAITIAAEHSTVARCYVCGAKVSAHLSNQLSVTSPRGERTYHFHVEKVEPGGKIKGGERLVLFAGDVRLTAMSHAAQPSVRVSLSKLGKRVADPLAVRIE
jgi:hypothetical protein